MANRKTVELKPSRPANKDIKKLFDRAREIQERFIAEGRTFSDSTEIIRADRDSRR